MCWSFCKSGTKLAEDIDISSSLEGGITFVITKYWIDFPNISNRHMTSGIRLFGEHHTSSRDKIV
jgi:hypothetical protein